MKNLIPFFLASFLIFLIGHDAWSQTKSNHKYVIRIHSDQKQSIGSLADMNLDYVSEHKGQTTDAVVSADELSEISLRGFKTDILPMDPPGVNVTQYPSYDEVVDKLNYYAAAYPQIVKLDTLGYSETWQLMIPVLKLSDHPELEEDEPAILFDGLHHAREPVGMECTLTILEYLLRNYGSDPRVTNWVNDNEIWFVPMINPEGYKYLVENNLSSPWWRKNLHDNNLNGIIDQDYDGIDLNRNYDWGWITGGSGDPASWVYRGTKPFSESETEAKRQWALVQKPVLSLTYHSYGEQILYSWLDRPLSPDNNLIIEIADSMSVRLPRTGGIGNYSVDPMGCTTGYSQCWMYGEMGTIEYTVETANEFVPPLNVGMQVAQDNLQAALYLLDRVKGPGISGHIFDGKSGLPVSARIKIMQLTDQLVSPRMSDTTYGRYYRLLQPGTYTVLISKVGYVTQTIENVIVNGDKLTELNVVLQPIASGIEQYSTEPGLSVCTGARIYPNPANQEASIEFQLSVESPVTVRLIDLLGREIRTLHQGILPPGRQIIRWNGKSNEGASVKPGLYICLIETKGGTSRLSLIKQ
ncbi:MAG: M14 family zinc carboxypeptidase [Bacteroidales bacterium]